VALHGKPRLVKVTTGVRWFEEQGAVSNCGA